MKDNTLDNIESAINTVCEWINDNAKETNCMGESSILPNMVEALANLISANASLMG